jgi:hypothetical protein
LVEGFGFLAGSQGVELHLTHEAVSL